MDLDALERVWPVLAGLAYLLVACSLSVLAAYRRAAIETHDRAREARLLIIAFESAEDPGDDVIVMPDDEQQHDTRRAA